MRRTILSIIAGAALVSCAESVRLISPQTGSTVQNPVGVTVEFHPRANVSTFKATVEAPPSSGVGTVDITGNFTPAPTAGQQSSASVTLPQHTCPVGNPSCTQERTLRFEALMSPRQAFDVTGHGEKIQLVGSTTPPPPPDPFIRLSAPVDTAAVHWGDPASFTVEVEGHNGFSGPVTLTPQNLPAGASAAPQTVSLPQNGTATANISVATLVAGTALGSTSPRIRANVPFSRWCRYSL